VADACAPMQILGKIWNMAGMEVCERPDKTKILEGRKERYAEDETDDVMLGAHGFPFSVYASVA
jgi:hypothetical protein